MVLRRFRTERRFPNRRKNDRPTGLERLGNRPSFACRRRDRTPWCKRTCIPVGTSLEARVGIGSLSTCLHCQDGRFSEVTKHYPPLLDTTDINPFGVRFGVRRTERQIAFMEGTSGQPAKELARDEAKPLPVADSKRPSAARRIRHAKRRILSSTFGGDAFGLRSVEIPRRDHPQSSTELRPIAPFGKSQT